MQKFKVGDTIGAIEQFHGIERGTVTKIDDRYYHLKILNGIATIPFSAESNYRKIRVKK